MAKYEMTGENMMQDSCIVYRIKALRDFGNVKKGDMGGWIESEKNLSHDWNCWVAGNAVVYGHAQVFGRAVVDGNAVISGYAKVHSEAEVHGSARVHEHAQVFGNGIVDGNAVISGYAKVHDGAKVHGNAVVYGHAQVFGRAVVDGNAQVFEGAIVGENARIFEYAKVYGKTRVYGNAKIHENARIFEYAEVYGEAIVHENAVVYGHAQVFGRAVVDGNAVISGYANVYGNAKIYENISTTKNGEPATITRPQEKGDIGEKIESEKKVFYGDICLAAHKASIRGTMNQCAKIKEDEITMYSTKTKLWDLKTEKGEIIVKVITASHEGLSDAVEMVVKNKCSLRGICLVNANLSGKNLDGADFRDANLSGTSFVGSSLTNANFREAFLDGANFWEADIKGADFRGVVGNFDLPENWKNATFDHLHIFPIRIKVKSLEDILNEKMFKAVHFKNHETIQQILFENCVINNAHFGKEYRARIDKDLYYTENGFWFPPEAVISDITPQKTKTKGA